MNAHACARESVLNVFATYLCEVAFCSNQACLSSCLNKYASMSFLDIQHFLWMFLGCASISKVPIAAFFKWLMVEAPLLTTLRVALELVSFEKEEPSFPYFNEEFKGLLKPG